MLKNNPVQTKGIGGERYSVGTGFIIIPGSVDRANYIQNCYRNGRVSLQGDDGSFMLDVPIALGVLKEIDFPDDFEMLGSQVIYVTFPVHNQPIVVDRILKDDETTDFIENEFKLQKHTDSGSVSITGTADKGNLFINVESQVSDGGKVYVDVTNPDNTAEVIVNIKGDLQAEIKNIVMNVLEELNVTVVGDVNVSTESDINLVPEGVVNLGTGDEPIPLGETLQGQLDALQTKVDLIINAIENGIPIAQDGGVGYQLSMTGILAAAVDADFSNMNSEKSFTE